MNPKPSLEVRIEMAKAHCLEVINQTPSLTFIEFVDTQYHYWEWGEHVLISQKLAEGNNKDIPWIMKCLESERIQGEYLLLFENYKNRQIKTPAQWAKVSFQGNYEWVKLMWELGHGIYLMSLDEHSFLHIIQEEDYVELYRQTRQV